LKAPADIAVEDGVVTKGAEPAADVPWWSFTKTVIAAAALVLVRDGRLTLDAVLPGRPCTLRQLLQHRAGLTDYGRLAAYHDAVARRQDAWPASELLERADAKTLVYPPGEGWLYSNIGYLFVRRLIEETTGEELGSALARLVLRPLAIERARLARRREDLADVLMGQTRDYDPRWVYHGLLVGPLQEAALLLDRLMAGHLLPGDLLAAMLRPHPVGGPVAGRPWVSPGYGLGLMTGSVTNGSMIAGHTGGGPGTVVAIYHHLSDKPARTAAAFSPGDDQGLVEDRCVLSLAGAPAKKDG
jgi:CubicO group peptidase (beta-lactamase class C family)